MSRFCCAIAMVGMVCGAGWAQETESMKAHRTDWFQKARWGVFTHYMADTVLKDATVESWNAAVDRFDVNALADTLASVGAGYYVITLGQNSGFYCSPNAAYDRITGILPSKCAKRDLIADLYAALHPKGIRLMVYLPSGAPDRDPEAMKALEWKPGKHPRWDTSPVKPGDADPRLESFQRKWESVIREWSERWGEKVAGWWFDGCYYPDAMYRHPDPPNFDSFAAAARAGNPGGIVAFNPGVVNPIITLTPAEDYTAGEIDQPQDVACPGPRIGQAQYHMLSYIGKWWAGSPPRFTPEQVAAMTRKIVEKGGVVTWDVPIGADGALAPEFMDHLRAAGQACKIETAK